MAKTLQTTFIAAVLIVLGCGESRETIEKKTEILDVFIAFHQAFAEKDGTKTVEYVDSKTLKLYQSLARTASRASYQELMQLDAYSQLIVLQLRTFFVVSELQKLDGKKAFIAMVEKDKITRVGDRSIDNLNVQLIDDNTARIYDAVGTSGFSHLLTKVDGKWKIALADAYPKLSKALEKKLQELKLRPEDFFLEQLKAYGKVDRSILDGPRK